MDYCYLRIRAKGFTNYGIEDLLAKVYKDGTVLLFDDVSGSFTRCHNLSKSATKKLIRAYRIAKVNKLRCVLEEACPTANYIINGWKGRTHPETGRKITEEEAEAVDSIIFKGLEECMGMESIRMDARSWMIQKGISPSSYDFSSRFNEILNVK